MSLFEREISRAPNKGLEDEKGAYVDELPSATCWSNRPNGRGHIDVMVWGRGTDTTSPEEGEKNPCFAF